MKLIEKSDSIAEGLIKEAAKRIFFSKGLIYATTQEIADEAGINRALIHYYFRSRDLLFDIVLEEAMVSMMGKMRAILNSDKDLRNKIKEFLDGFILETSNYPYLENFIISEISKNPRKLKKFYPANDQIKEKLRGQIAREVEAGTLAAIDTDHFICNLMSLCKYPLIAKPIIQTVCGYNETAFNNFLLERKKVVYSIIFNEPYPEN